MKHITIRLTIPLILLCILAVVAMLIDDDIEACKHSNLSYETCLAAHGIK